MTTPEVPPPGLNWVTADKAATLWTVRRKYVPQVASAHGVGTEVFARLAAADGIYYLRELGDEAIHDWGRVRDYFHEFVLIDRSAGRITLIVAADD
ncbi:hypothetical protein ABT203_21720 [Streptomyces sp900105245]|uniref:hypothetical protein n=1 Tax=Streptomyces sp. 900105245 TaxID=3154379 RepID=UPI0033329836